MAKCPNCGKTLHLWNVKAECPHCHANIPNHNWEARLDEDARNREAAFFKLHTNLHLLRYAVIGTPLRLIRLLCSVLPLLGYLLPMAIFRYADGERPFSLLQLFQSDSPFALKQMLPMLKAALAGAGSDAGMKLWLALGLALLALLFGVIAFFLILLLFKYPGSPALMILHAVSLALYSVGAFLAGSVLPDLTSAGESALGIGAYLGVGAFALVFILDLIILLRPIRKKALRYIPTDELQREYAISIGAIKADEQPPEKKRSGKKEPKPDEAEPA